MRAEQDEPNHPRGMARPPAGVHRPRAHRTTIGAGCAVAILVGACGGTPSDSAPSATSASPRNTSPEGPVSFVEGDLRGALAQASADDRLLFVDVWAPWCEGCLALRSDVFPRTNFQRFSERFVFAAIDVDTEAAAPLLAKYGAWTLPTLLVIDPKSEELLGLHAGVLAPTELEALLERALDLKASGATLASTELSRGHAMVAAGDGRAAARHYTNAAELLRGDARTDAISSALEALTSAGDAVECARLARAELEDGASDPRGRVKIAVSLGRCAERCPPGDERNAHLTLAAFILGRSPAKLPHTGSAAGDAGADESTFEAAERLAMHAWVLRALGDDERANAEEVARLELLHRAAEAAPNPEAARAFDHARAKALIASGRSEEALAMLRRRVEELPRRYEVHGRLGTTLLELGRPREAIEPLRVAVSLAYGPPRLVYLDRLASALEATGATDEATKSLREAARGWEALPPSQRDPEREARVKSRLESAR